MATVVNFTGNGISFAKKRKVMPGTNKNFKPEIEQCNWFQANDDVEASRIGYEECTVWPTTGVTPLGQVQYRVWDWIPLYLPRQDLGQSGTRKGEKVLYRYARFKGYIMVTNHLITSTRWRMVLYRIKDLTISDGTDINANYPKVYSNWVNTDSSSEIDHKEYAWCNNFYTKVARVDTRNWCKHKVIASGVIPRTFTLQRLRLTGTVPDGAIALIGQNFSNVTTADFDEAMHIPIDVKVKLDDTVDFSVSYYLAIEMDNPTAVEWSEQNQAFIRIQTAAGSAVRFIFFARLYYEDY